MYCTIRRSPSIQEDPEAGERSQEDEENVKGSQLKQDISIRLVIASIFKRLPHHSPNVDPVEDDIEQFEDEEEDTEPITSFRPQVGLNTYSTFTVFEPNATGYFRFEQLAPLYLPLAVLSLPVRTAQFLILLQILSPQTETITTTMATQQPPRQQPLHPLIITINHPLRHLHLASMTESLMTAPRPSHPYPQFLDGRTDESLLENMHVLQTTLTT